MLVLQMAEHPEVGPINDLCELDGNYKWNSCTGTVPRSIQYPGGDSEVSGSPCLRSQEETTGSVDRKGQYDDYADWFNENPNRAGGTASTGTDATVAQYFSYIRGIVTMNWAVINRPAVKVSVLGHPSRLVKNTDIRIQRVSDLRVSGSTIVKQAGS